jgi:hypothetical protein
MEIASRWAVSDEHVVDGVITDTNVAEWVDAACRAYLDRCPRLQAMSRASGARVVCRAGDLPPAAALGRPSSVLVTATAPEFRPSSFTIAVRLRALGDEDAGPLNVRCEVRVEDPATGEARPLGNEIRDELIAVEQAARFYS